MSLTVRVSGRGLNLILFFTPKQAVTGLPEPRPDHAVAMSQFALDCLEKMHILVKKLEVHLGPDTGKLSPSSLSEFVAEISSSSLVSLQPIWQ